eukprot:14763749-Ditylum_brightwellii.AAC.1
MASQSDDARTVKQKVAHSLWHGMTMHDQTQGQSVNSISNPDVKMCVFCAKGIYWWNLFAVLT